MNCMKKLVDIDGILINVEVAVEKVRFLSEELFQLLSDPRDDVCKLYEWDRITVRSDIVFDYAVIVEEKLAELRKSFDDLFEQMKKIKGK